MLNHAAVKANLASGWMRMLHVMPLQKFKHFSRGYCSTEKHCHLLMIALKGPCDTGLQEYIVLLEISFKPP